MRLLIVAPGTGPVPPIGRGAIEAVVWEYAERLRARGHAAEISNARPRLLALDLARRAAGRERYDWIWTHHDRAVGLAARFAPLFGARHVHTSHRPITGAEDDPYGARLVRKGARADYHLGLTEEGLAAVRRLNGRTRTALAPNGVDVASHRWSERGMGAVCVGGVSRRKRQRDVAEAGVVCDFVGPLDRDDEDTRFVASLATYRGEWSRAELRARLTNYAVLILFSVAEAQPLVVGEAFASGLSVVLSRESARNVDVTLPFVTIVGTADELPRAVAEAEARNQAQRAAIRAHAEAAWDWGPKVAAVEAQLEGWRRE